MNARNARGSGSCIFSMICKSYSQHSVTSIIRVIYMVIYFRRVRSTWILFSWNEKLKKRMLFQIHRAILRQLSIGRLQTVKSCTIQHPQSSFLLYDILLPYAFKSSQTLIVVTIPRKNSTICKWDMLLFLWKSRLSFYTAMISKGFSPPIPQAWSV